jgi:hypothetical protein
VIYIWHMFLQGLAMLRALANPGADAAVRLVAGVQTLPPIRAAGLHAGNVGGGQCARTSGAR